MRVAAVIHQFPPGFTTGTEILCLRSAQVLTARGHEVGVFTGNPEAPAGRLPQREIVGGIEVCRFGTARPRRLLLSSRIADEFANPAAQSQLLEALRAFRPDVIHLFQSQQFGLGAVPDMAALAPVLATITDFHFVCPLLTASFEDGSACEGPGADGAACAVHLKRREISRLKQERGAKRAGLAAREFFRRLPGADTPARLARAMARRVKSADAALAAVDLVLVGPPRLHAMLKAKPGVRCELFGHAAPPVGVSDRPVGANLHIGFFSSISPHKGAHVLLDAIAAIPQDLGMTFTICGPPGPDASYVREMAARAGADPRVAFKLGVPHDQIGAEMSNADIVVVPSLWDENNPLVLLDALEAGRYALVSNSPGMTGAIAEPLGGRSFPAGDAGALAAALIALARDPAPVMRARTNPVRQSQFDAYIDAIEIRYSMVRAQRSEPAIPAS